MLDDFMVRAALAGIGVAFASAPLGCFVVWRRMAYFRGCHCACRNPWCCTVVGVLDVSIRRDDGCGLAHGADRQRAVR